MHDFPINEIREQLERCYSLQYYKSKFLEMNIKPSDIGNIDDFRSLPLMDTEDLLGEIDNGDQFGSLYHPATTFIGFTPTGQQQFMPEYHTTTDIEVSADAWAQLYESAGVGDGDVIYNSYNYEYFGAAHIFQSAVQKTGGAVIPAGPGDTDRAIEIIKKYDVNVFMGNPSFAMKLANSGVEFDTILAGGEPFTSIPGYRTELKDAFENEVLAIDTYGLSEILPIAAECEAEHGLHLADDYIYAEVIDPATQEVLPAGERGELVVTHLNKESMPLLRYRTGDLTIINDVECDTNRRSLPRSVFGRTDSMTKVKGVKFFPHEVQSLLSGIEGTTGEFQVVITNQGGSDSLKLIVEGNAQTDQIRETIESEIVQSIDDIEMTNETPGEEMLCDKRFKS